MGLQDVANAVKKTADGIPDTKFVGMKLEYVDYKELCEFLDIPEGAGGAAAFKKMLSIVLASK